jgi:hypothetical protein
MSLEGLLFAVVLTLVVVMISAAPLLLRRRAFTAGTVEERQRARLTLYYERALRNVRDLDEDHALGKIDPDSWAADRALWVARGVAALEALDALDRAPLPARDQTDAAIDRAIDAAIDAAVARARQEVTPSA